MYYEVYAVDLFGEPLSGYVLDDPIDVCVPLHPRLAANIGNVVLVSTREDGTYTMHSTKVMLDDEGLTICGKLSELSAKVAAAYVGSPSAMPTPTPVPAPEGAGYGWIRAISLVHPLADDTVGRGISCRRADRQIKALGLN